MQGMLVILVLVSGVGVKFNTEQFVNCGYNTWSRGSKLPAVVGVSPSWLRMNYLMNEETSSLQEDLNSSVSSNSEIAKKPTTMNYVVEGIGGVIGGIGGSAFAAYIVFPLIPPYRIENEDSLPKGAWECIVAEAIVAGLGRGFHAFMIGLYTGYPIGSAIGVSVTGKIIGQHGSFWKSLLGSYIGLGSGTLLAIITGGEPIGVFLGPPIGAVIGYNWK